MDNFCRLCAEIRDKSEIIASIYDPNKSIEQKLIACCQWNVGNSAPNLPQGVCIFCSDKLDKSWQFSQNVQLSQQKLCEVFNETKPPLVSLIPTVPATPETPFGECSKFSPDYQDCIDKLKSFQCNVCFKTFKTDNILRAHCKKQSELKCDNCSEVFCKVTKFTKHKEEGCKNMIENVDIPENHPAFVDCSSELLLKLEPDINISIHSDVEQAIDEMNRDQHRTQMSHSREDIKANKQLKKPKKSNKSKRYERKMYSLDHCNTNEDGKPNYYCYLCFKRFNKFPLLKGHMVVHTYPHRFKCKFCNARFRTERHYTSHQKNHIDYFCDICNKKCKSAFALKVHKRMHVGSSVKMYGCGECDHFFVDVSTYYNHMRRRHGLDTAAALLIEPNGTTKAYVCEQCGKDFKERSSLQAHSVIHLDIRPFACDICPKTFKNKYLLKTHKDFHEKRKSVQCTECGKVYSCKSALMKHMEEHTGVYTKLYNYDFCDRTFRNSYNMQNHRRTHTGEKPYRCEICKYDSTTKSSHERHLKTISHMSKLNETVNLDQQQVV